MDSRLQPYRLLLVEAHEGLRNDLARALSFLGYSLDAYASFDAIPGEANRPRYAVCILDQSVDPARQRAESLGFARDRTIWTSLAGEGFAEGHHEGDPHLRILTKPFSIAVLERLIVDCLQGTSGQWTNGVLER